MAVDNTLKPYSVNTKMPKASLEYITVTPKEYNGPYTISGPAPHTYGTAGAVNKLSKTYKVGVNESAPEATIVYADVQAGVAVPTKSYDKIVGKGIPEVAETPKPAGHQHSATEVYEDAGRLWFTDDERYQLRELYLSKDLTLDAAAKKMIVFTMPDLIEPGEQDIYVRFPWNGTLKEVYAVNGNASVGESMVIQVEKCPQSEMDATPNWTPVSTPLEIYMTEVSARRDLGIIVNRNDHFRLNLLNVASDVRGLTVELVILTNT